MQNKTYEEAIQRLEEISKEIEKGEISLNQSVKLFKEGTELVAFCKSEIENAKIQIKNINQSASNITNQ